MKAVAPKPSITEFALKFYKLTKNVENEQDIFKILDQCFSDLFQNSSITIFRKEIGKEMFAVYQNYIHNNANSFPAQMDRFIRSNKGTKSKVDAWSHQEKLLTFIKVVDPQLIEYYIQIVFNEIFEWTEEDSLLLEMIVDSLKTKIMQTNAVKSLQSTLKKFQSLYQNSDFGITICSLDGKYEMVNPAFCKMMGYSEDELKSTFYVQITHLNDVDNSIERFQRLKDGEYRNYNFEKIFVHKDRSLIHTHCIVNGLYDEDDQLTGVICTIKDISKEKKYLNSLKKSEARYKKVFDNNIYPLFVYNINPHIITANPSLCRLLGYSSQELNKMNPTDLIIEPGFEELKGIFIRLLHAEKGDLTKKMLLKRSDGREIEAYVSFKSMVSENDIVESIIGTIGDIKVMQDTLDSIDDSERKYQLLFEQSNVGMMKLDLNYRMIASNPAICKMLKYSSEELCKMSLKYIIEKQDWKKAFECLEILKTGEQFNCTFEGTLRQKDGGEIYGIINFSGYYKDGQLEEIFANLVDITELKVAQDLLLESEYKYKLLFNNQAAGILNYDKNFSLVTANKTALNMLGFQIRELADLDIEEIIHKDYLQKFMDLRIQIQKGELEEGLIECVFGRNDGREMHGFTCIKALYSPTQEFQGIIMTIIDIDEQKQAKLEGKISEQRYQSLFDNVVMGLVIYNKNTLEISAANKAAVAMFKYDDDKDLVGKHINILFPEKQENGKTTSVFLKKYVKEFVSRKKLNMEMDLITRSGNILTTKVNSFYLTPDDQYIVSIIEDITLEKAARKAQENIRAKQIEIDAKNRELASYTLFLTQKNNALGEISQQLLDLNRLDPDSIKTQIRKTVNKINNELHKQEDWMSFRIYFENIYPSFYDHLLNAAPNLTHNEQRLCAYIKMKLSNREVANLLYISLKAVETARYRLKKKLGLGPEINLNEYINNLGENGA